jgi:hypothetical protein
LRPIIIRSTHKSRALAEAHARLLAKEYNANVRIYQFTKNGKRSNRGNSFTFRVAPKRARKTMFRLTVRYPYKIRKGRHKESPDSKDLVIQGWFRTKRIAESQVEDFKELAIEEIERLADDDPRVFIPRESRHSQEIKSVPYDKKLLDREPEIKVE